MYNITINGKSTLKSELDFNSNKVSGTLNGKAVEADILNTGNQEYHLLLNHQSYNILIVKADYAEKKLIVKVNGKKYTLDVKDKYDELLHNLGLDNIAAKKINDIKAPMPGMVLNILVSEGQQIKKGDSLLVLEAMKMENVLKSPTDGVIKKIV